jgi:hypothetical protein
MVTTPTTTPARASQPEEEALEEEVKAEADVESQEEKEEADAESQEEKAEVDTEEEAKAVVDTEEEAKVDLVDSEKVEVDTEEEAKAEADIEEEVKIEEEELEEEEPEEIRTDLMTLILIMPLEKRSQEVNNKNPTNSQDQDQPITETRRLSTERVVMLTLDQERLRK